MPARPIRHRRARRTDFDAVRAILMDNGLAETAAQRAELRRFRRLVADLGADLYVAEIDARVQGIVHVTYSRLLVGGPLARLELLAVAPEIRGHGVGRSLAALAASRARRRGCTALRCAAAPETPAARFLARTGWRVIGTALEFDLGDLAQ